MGCGWGWCGLTFSLKEHRIVLYRIFRIIWLLRGHINPKNFAGLVATAFFLAWQLLVAKKWSPSVGARVAKSLLFDLNDRNYAFVRVPASEKLRYRACFSRGSAYFLYFFGVPIFEGEGLRFGCFFRFKKAISSCGRSESYKTSTSGGVSGISAKRRNSDGRICFFSHKRDKRAFISGNKGYNASHFSENTVR